MRASAAVALGSGTLLCCVATLIGVLTYLGNPGDGFYMLGHDELQHRAFADLLLNSGDQSLAQNVLQAQDLTGDASWGTGLVIALSDLFFGTQLAYLVVKLALHLLASRLLYSLLAKYRNERLALYGTFFFLAYPPLLIYATSFLKDDLVASLVIILAALIDRKRYLLAVLLVPLMIAVRANSVLFPIIMLAYLRRASIKQLLILLTVPMAVAVLIVSQGYFDKLQDVLRLPVSTVLFYMVKYMIGPLPTNILDYDTEQAIIFPWYVFSFFAVLGSFCLPGFYASVYRNWFWILILLGAALGPYLPYVNEADVVGPRQFASIGWLFFIMFYERILVRYRFMLRNPQSATWSPVT